MINVRATYDGAYTICIYQVIILETYGLYM